MGKKVKAEIGGEEFTIKQGDTPKMNLAWVVLSRDNKVYINTGYPVDYVVAVFADMKSAVEAAEKLDRGYHGHWVMGVPSYA